MLKKTLLFTLLALSSTLQAQTPTPTPSGRVKLLTCKNNFATVTFSICGIRNCTGILSVGSIQTVYNLKRSKLPDVSIRYTPTAQSANKCIFRVSALRFGLRTIRNSPRCEPKLKGAQCNFSEI